MEVIYFYSAFSGVIVEIEAVSFDSLMCSSPAKRVCPTPFKGESESTARLTLVWLLERPPPLAVLSC